MKKVLFFILFLFTGTSVNATLVTPVTYASLTGGQYFFEGNPSSFGGNFSLYFSPAVNFSDTRALVPVFNIDYRGMRDVRELVGGNALTRQTADYGLSFVYVSSFGDYKTRLRLGYAQSLINETKDEDWGGGLFDYTRLLSGAQAQRSFGDWDINASAEFYALSFDNYDSLVRKGEEEFKTAVDTTTYREISGDAGKNVLDYYNAALTLQGARPLGRSTIADMSWRGDLRMYADQPVIQDEGRFSSDKRLDMLNTFSASLTYRKEKVEAGISGEGRLLISNQNSYDASGAKYVQNFYSYTDIALSPELSFYLGQEGKKQLSFSWSVVLKFYADRPVREEDGAYTDDSIINRENSISVSYLHPVSENLKALAGASHLVSSSNMSYEQSYRYNYSTANYYAGLNLQF
ncbi:MAG: hypothetical protein ACQESB_02835 [Elusimicrobiota bacterium]